MYTCETMVQHSDSNILTSSIGSDTGTLSVQSEYILLVLYNLKFRLYMILNLYIISYITKDKLDDVFGLIVHNVVKS